MASSPVFIGTPKTWQTTLSVANTARDGSGTLADLMTGGANGSRVDKIRCVAAGPVTQGVIRIFLYDGTNTYLRNEIIVPPTTPSTTAPVWSGELTFYLGLPIPATWHIKAATNNAETFHIFAEGGDE